MLCSASSSALTDSSVADVIRERSAAPLPDDRIHEGSIPSISERQDGRVPGF